MKIFDENSFQKYDLTYLKLLEVDDHLNKLLTKYRSELELPKEGLNFDKDNLEKIKAKDKHFFDQLLLQAIRILMVYKLPFYWIITMKFLIIFNVAFPPDRELYPPITFDIKSEKEWPSKAVLTMIIREKCSIERILKVIKNNGPNIRSAFQDLSTPPSPRKQNVDLHKEIRRSYDHKKMNYHAIAKSLSERKGSFSPDYEIVTVEANRFNKEIDNLIKRKGTLEDIITDLILEGNI